MQMRDLERETIRCNEVIKPVDYRQADVYYILS